MNLKNEIKKISHSMGLLSYLMAVREFLFPTEADSINSELLNSRKSFYSQFIKKGDLVFDVGANYGNRTKVFLKLGANVIAMEPQPQCAEYLKNRFVNNLIVVEKGCGSGNSQGSLYLTSSSTVASVSKDWINSVKDSRFKDYTWNNSISINITTLEDLILEFGVPVFCKIDVEGYELEVIKGLKRPIKYISFEFTIPEQLDVLHQCLTQLSALGNVDFNYTVGESTKLEAVSWMGLTETIKQSNSFESQNITWGDIYVRFDI